MARRKNIPWMRVEDFIEMSRESEKEGGRLKHTRMMNAFNEMMQVMIWGTRVIILHMD